MKKSFFKSFLKGILLTIAVMLGAGGQVLMAVGGTVAADGGQPGESNKATDEGVASVTKGQQIAPDLYETDLETAITELDPMGTAFLSAISGAQSRTIHSQEFEFYSIGPRVIRTETTAAYTTEASTTRATITVADNGFCTKDDTIRVVGVAGSDGDDLMLIVIGKEQNTGKPIVYAKNGVNGTNQVPSIPNGTTLIRMGKSCSESKAQTARVNSVPSSEKGCVQNFMLQIEQTEFDRITDKRVSWDFDDIVDWNMRDYKVTKELTYLFGVGGLDRHENNDFENNYTMRGAWWQAGRDIEIGHVVTDASGNVLDVTGAVCYAATSATKLSGQSGTYTGLVTGDYYVLGGSTPKRTAPKVEIDGTDLVAFTKSAFLGNGGSQTKYLFAGANVIEAFDNIKGKQYDTKDIVNENNLTIQNFKSSFGTIKLVYDKLFDVCGMANAAFMLDKAYLRKVDFVTLKRTELKLKESGQRNSNGVVLQEVNAIYLQYADAHARVWLKGCADLYDYNVAGKYDAVVQSTASITKTAENFTNTDDGKDAVTNRQIADKAKA